MKIITRQDRAYETIKAFRDARKIYGENFQRGKGKEILERLEDLGDPPDPDKVDEIFGYNRTSVYSCQECGARNLEIVAVLGDEDDPESCLICVNCLEEVLRMALERSGK